MKNPYPTFANSRDRVVWLLGEYKIPVSITIFGLGLWAAFLRPEIPTPPDWVGAVILSWTILALPCYFVSRRVVNWLYDPPKVFVGIVRPGNTTIYDLQKVPPDVWNEAKRLDDARPMPIEEGIADYVVTEFEWLDDIHELRIRGVESEMLDPGEAYAYHEKVDRYYDSHIELLAAYSKLKAVVAELIQTGHDDGLMQAIAARDNSLAPNVSARELLAEIESNDEIKDAGEVLDWDAIEPEADTNGTGEVEQFEEVNQ